MLAIGKSMFYLQPRIIVEIAQLLNISEMILILLFLPTSQLSSTLLIPWVLVTIK
jgi:hypothetical protein